MNQPLIGISGSIESDESRIFVLRSYLNSLLNVQAIPVLLSPDANDDAIVCLLPKLDGILMAGGVDVDPARYGEKSTGQNVEVSPLRDTFEFRLLKKAWPLQIPVFGICRGIQVLNVFAGGTLWQDLPTEYAQKDGTAVVHKQTVPMQIPSHAVEIVKGTKLSSLFDEKTIQVNSSHHQAVKTLGNCLISSAWAPDGVLEAFECPSHPFFCGVQWHPERLTDEYSEKLFRAFTAAARAYREKLAQH